MDLPQRLVSGRRELGPSLGAPNQDAGARVPTESVACRTTDDTRGLESLVG